jgi:hypothetical protein
LLKCPRHFILCAFTYLTLSSPFINFHISLLVYDYPLMTCLYTRMLHLFVVEDWFVLWNFFCFSLCVVDQETG